MKDLVDAMVEMREQETLALTDKYLEEGADPVEILDAYREAMTEVGRRFEKEVYFLPELVLAGEMLKAGTEKVKPLLKGKGDVAKKHGRVTIGTVKGDIHDIGKDIVSFMLDVSGYDVLDLGIDVPAQRFVDAVKDFKPAVVGLSGFLTLAFDSMKETIDAIEDNGLREGVRIMIGGGQIDNQIRDYVGADAYGKDAMEAVRLCRQWIIGGNA